MFAPKFSITARTSRALMEIEACRVAIEGLPITADLLISLRKSAKLEATHYSTYIEGNQLSQKQVEAVIVGQGNPGRKRDQEEVKNYYAALAEVEAISKSAQSLVNNHILLLHSLVHKGRRGKSSYRDGQNVIKESDTGSITYMPPEAKDVSVLMHELLDWINGKVAEGELPLPIVAALTHYQFVTIHPFYDGNGRTARLLTTLILHMNGYGMKGIYALEEYYAKNLPAYYHALDVGDSHNYYLGRAESDVSGFIDYFCSGMAESFQKVKESATNAQRSGQEDAVDTLMYLEPRQRQLLALFKQQPVIKSSDILRICLQLKRAVPNTFAKNGVKRDF